MEPHAACPSLSASPAEHRVSRVHPCSRLSDFTAFHGCVIFHCKHGPHCVFPFIRLPHIHPPIHPSFIHPSSHPSIHTPIYPPMHPPIYPYINTYLQPPSIIHPPSMSIHLFIHPPTQASIHPSIHGHLGCFHLLVVVNPIIKNTHLQLFVRAPVFHSFGVSTEEWNSQAHGNSVQTLEAPIRCTLFCPHLSLLAERLKYQFPDFRRIHYHGVLGFPHRCDY